jgi:hypothetical protein
MSALIHDMDQWWLFQWDLEDARDRVQRGLVPRSIGVRALASHRFQYLYESSIGTQDGEERASWRSTHRRIIQFLAPFLRAPTAYDGSMPSNQIVVAWESDVDPEAGSKILAAFAILLREPANQQPEFDRSQDILQDKGKKFP